MPGMPRPTPPASVSRRDVAVSIGCGLAVTLTLLLFTLLPSSQPFAKRYRQLFQWDSYWYQNIAENGYLHAGLPEKPTGLDPTKENVVFFPGYPLVTRYVSTVTGIPVPVALLLVAQAACWGFVTYLLLLFRRWGFSFAMTFVGTFLVLSFPSSYYLVSGYTEALFFCMFMGMVYFQQLPGRRAEILSAAHGFLMSATRITGLPLALYPFARLGFPVRGRSLRPYVRAAAVTGAALLGGLSFFLFCQFRFGDWNLYMRTEYIGWGVEPFYTAVLYVQTYQLHLLLPHLPSFGEIGLLSIPFMVAWSIVLLIIELTVARRRDAGGWDIRRGLYFCAFIIFYLSVSGSATRGFMSIIRFMFGMHLCLTLVTMHLLSRLKLSHGTLHCALALLLMFSVLLLRLQSDVAEHFLRGDWVA